MNVVLQHQLQRTKISSERRRIQIRFELFSLTMRKKQRNTTTILRTMTTMMKEPPASTTLRDHHNAFVKLTSNYKSIQVVFGAKKRIYRKKLNTNRRFVRF